MPHFIIDCSETIIQQQAPDDIVQAVYDAAEATGLFAVGDIKVRLHPYHYFTLGPGKVVGGDVVSGPMPRETLSCLLDLTLPVQFVQGNADREVLAQMTGTTAGAVPDHVHELTRWVARQFQREHAPREAQGS
jgi:hypothetical protein